MALPRSYSDEAILDPSNIMITFQVSEKKVRFVPASFQMVKERQEEVSQAENEARLLQVQERFPGDDLFLLTVDCFKAQKFKSLAARRKSAPSSVIKNALTSSKSKPGLEKSAQGQGIPSSLSSYEINSSSIEPPTSARGHSSESGTDKSQRLQPPTSLSNTKRLYIMEGPVHVTVGLQTQVRYLFLFDDVLIIAKPNKSCTLFRLKHRLRVCELWLATCTQDVSEINNSPESSFVLGWPTTNNVLTFTSKEEKDLWWQSLSKHIKAERERQDCKSVPVIVCNRDEDSKSMHTKTFQAGYQSTSKDILLMAMEQFNLPTDQHENYQLWVQSGKEEDLYPLIGHEYPHSIKMNHTREAALHREDLYFPGDLDQLSSAENELRGYQCQFILRRKGRSSSGVSSDTSGIQRKLRNKKSHFKLGFRRSLSSKPASPNSSESESQLFGKSLSVLSSEGEPPQPILDLLTNIYNNGPFTHGIFRKSANARMVRELKARLNAGEQFDLGEVHVSTAASMLTDFLRNLPDCLFTGELYSQWLLVNQIKDVPEKIDTVKRILEKLPEANLTLMRYIFCIFYHITLNAEENSMNGTNLAICISPSMIWPPLSAGAMAQAHATKESPQLLQFLISHCVEIFGKDVTTLFGPPPARKETVCPVDSGGDSDGALGRRNASSMDSIEQEFSDEIEPNNNAQIKKWGVPPLVSPSSLSRDSGITSSDNQIYPDSDNTDTTDSGVNSQERLNTILNSAASKHSRFNQNEGYFASEDIILAPTRRARTGSDPSVVSPEIRRRLQMFQKQDGENGNISPETLKFIEDVTKESRSTLLLPGSTQRPPKRDPPPTGYHSPGRLLNSAPSSATNSKSSSLEKVPQVSGSTAATESSPARVYSRRVSAPSVPTSDQSFPNRMAISRQSASSMSSSSSDRLSDGQSSSSTEKLFSGKAHMQRVEGANKTSEVTYFLPSTELQAKNLSPRGSKVATRSSSFMKALTPDNRTSSHRPTTSSRALNRQVSPGKRRHVTTGEATPPSEFFPKDAMRHSLPIQDNEKEKIMKTIEEKQETQDSQRPTELRVSTQNEGNLKNSPPSYHEAVNRRALFQKSSHSVDSDLLQREEAPSKPQHILESKRPLSLDRPVTVERQRSKGKERRQVVGIYFHDSESSDDEISDLENLRLQRSLSGSVTGPAKARQIRRSSSDSKASSRKPSNSSNGGKSKHYMPTGQLFYGQDSVFVETSPDRDTPTNSTSSSDRTITSSEPSGQRQKGQNLERNGSPVRHHTSSPRRNYPQGQNHPPHIQPRETARQRDLPSPSSGLRRSHERDVLSELKKKNWQKSRKGDSFDSGMAADEVANMDFDDESYV